MLPGSWLSEGPQDVDGCTVYLRYSSFLGVGQFGGKMCKKFQMGIG